MSDIEQNQLEEERQDRKKKKKKKKKNKKKRKKSNDKKRGKEKEKETTTDEHDDEASLVKRTSTTTTATTKKKKPSIDGRRRKSYIFPIDEAAHSLCVDTTAHALPHTRTTAHALTRSLLFRQEPAVPLHVWFYQMVLNFLWPPLNYYRLHLLYICCCSVFRALRCTSRDTCTPRAHHTNSQTHFFWCIIMSGGLLIYLSQGPGKMSYTDALFLSTSAVTTCGCATHHTHHTHSKR